MIITNSELSDFQRCPRMHYLGSVRRLGPKRAPSPLRAAQIGTEVHAALDQYYSGATQADVLAALESRFDVFEEITPGSDSAKAARLVATIVEFYFEWLAESGADSGLTNAQPETTQRREHPDFPGVVFQGKLDLLTDEELIDFKTCSVPLESKSREVLRTRQGVFYAWLLAGTGRRVARVKFRIMRQSSHSERTSPPYETETELPINAAMLAALERDLLEIVPQIQANYARETVPPAVPENDCSWRCDFYSVCPMFDRGEDAELVIQHEFTTVEPLARYNEEDREA